MKYTLWHEWFWIYQWFIFHIKKAMSKCVVCCVCNVSCLCPTSLASNSMNRRRKERDSFMRFVIVSILSFTWLFLCHYTERPLLLLFSSQLLIWIRQSETLAVHLPLPAWQLAFFFFFFLHKHLNIWGLRNGEGAEREGHEAGFLTHCPLPTMKQHWE